MNGRRGSHRAAGLILAFVLALAQGLQASALRDCPHHGGGEHAAASGHVMPGGSMPGGSMPVPDDPPGHPPCDCLGPCGAAAVAAVPPGGAESPFETVAGPRVVPAAPDAGHRSLRTIPFALPYPNGPPVRRS